MIGRIIDTDADIREGMAVLCRHEPRFAQALAMTGKLPLRRRPDGFATLFSAIVSQQISVAAANAVWRKLEISGLTVRAKVRRASEIELRDCGLSRQKADYARSLAASDIRFGELRSAPDSEVIAALVQVRGIGRWTAEIYAMFALGRADVFAPGDLALQEAARLLFDLDARPSEKALRQMALAWSPWQSVAARLLWAYYRVAKDREGIT